MDKLQEAMVFLFNEQPFYALFLMSFKRVLNAKLPYNALAGVKVDKKNFDVTLMLSSRFDDLPKEQRAGILQHEAEHIMRLHANRVRRQTLVANIAQDIAINQHIPRDWLPDGACHLESFQEQYPEMRSNMSFEQYYEILTKDAKELYRGIYGSGADGFRVDDHEFAEDGGVVLENIQDMIKEKALRAKDLVGRTDRRGAIPDHLTQLINEMGPPKLSWKKLLQQFVKKASKPNRVTTRYRPNRRYEMLFPGNRTKYTPMGIVIVDTSGSTWGLQSEFFAEIKAAYNAGASFTVIECDSEVKKVYEYHDKLIINPSGGGGTLYTPAFEEAIKHDPDFIIFFGDGDSADTVDLKVRCPVLWLLTPGARPPAKFGKVVHLEIKTS